MFLKNKHHAHVVEHAAVKTQTDFNLQMKLNQ